MRSDYKMSRANSYDCITVTVLCGNFLKNQRSLVSNAASDVVLMLGKDGCIYFEYKICLDMWPAPACAGVPPIPPLPRSCPALPPLVLRPLLRTYVHSTCEGEL